MKSKTHYKKCREIGVFPVPTVVDDTCVDEKQLAHQVWFFSLSARICVIVSEDNTGRWWAGSASSNADSLNLQQALRAVRGEGELSESDNDEDDEEDDDEEEEEEEEDEEESEGKGKRKTMLLLAGRFTGLRKMRLPSIY